MGIFVDTNNTVYVGDRSNCRVQVWMQGNMTPAKTLADQLNESYSLFVSIGGDIYVDNGRYNDKVSKWSANASNSTIALNVAGACVGLFVDMYDFQYCSLMHFQCVVKQSFIDDVNSLTLVAGNGTDGSSSTQLSEPRGIFVDIRSNLYVADCGNDRIQLFQSGQRNATTAVGSGAPSTIALNCPGAIVLDANGYPFIVDSINSRIVGAGPYGYRCVAGCSGTSGVSSNHLNYSTGLSFDSYGNLFVLDTYNSRVQKFLLMNSSCGKHDHVFLGRRSSFS